jgi:hypothetical protein
LAADLEIPHGIWMNKTPAKDKRYIMWAKKPDLSRCLKTWSINAPIARGCSKVVFLPGIWEVIEPGKRINGIKKPASMRPKGILSMKCRQSAAFRKQEGHQQCGLKFTFETPVGLKSCAKRRFQRRLPRGLEIPGFWDCRGGLGGRTGLNCQSGQIEAVSANFNRQGPRFKKSWKRACLAKHPRHGALERHA